MLFLLLNFSLCLLHIDCKILILFFSKSDLCNQVSRPVFQRKVQQQELMDGYWMSITNQLGISQLLILNKWPEILNNATEFHNWIRMIYWIIMLGNWFLIFWCSLLLLPTCTDVTPFQKYSNLNTLTNIILYFS